MEDNVSVLLATILTVVIIVLFPIYNVATRQDSIAKNMVVKATTNFVDNVRNKGYLEEKDYKEYINKIAGTGNTYEVELEVYKPILVETEESEVYEEKYTIEYTDEILSKIENTEMDVANADSSVLSEKVYYLNEGYKFYVRVRNTNVTQAQVLLDRLLKGELTDRIVVNYGGVVYINEWEKGESAETANANISISRPMNYNEKEFKYESITTVYDQYSDEYTTIYGIAVRLSEEIENGTKFKFLVSYNEVYALKDEDGNALTEASQREEYIKRCFKTMGFDAEASVEEREIQKNATTGLYSYKYMITLDNVNYDFDNNPLLKGTVQIVSGSADTKTGTLGELNSKEFIIMYEKEEELEIEYEIKLYDYNKKKKEFTQINLAGYDVDSADIYISVNKSNEDIAEIKYSDWKGRSLYGYFINTGFIYNRSKYDEAYFKQNGDSIKNSYNDEGKYEISGARNYGIYTIYVRDVKGREKIITINLATDPYLDIYFDERISNATYINNQGLEINAKYEFQLQVVGTVNGVRIGSRTAGLWGTSAYNENTGKDLIIKPSASSDSYRLATERRSTYVQKLGIQPNTAITSYGQETKGIKPEQVVYKFYIYAFRSDYREKGALLSRFPDAFVKHQPLVFATSIAYGTNDDKDYVFLSSEEEFMDWTNVEYRTGDGYYNKTTGEYYGNGDYWHVCNYYANTGEIKIVNKIVDSTDKIVSQVDK